MTRTVIADIVGNSFPSITIVPDTFVVWRNLDPVPHTVETDPAATYYFNVGPLATGEVSSPVWFNREGMFPYACRFHAEMAGDVLVSAKARVGIKSGDPMPTTQMMPGSMHDHGGHGSLAHFHGFVTGGRSGSKPAFLKRSLL